MYDIEHRFQEVALCVGETTERRQNISLINGLAYISVYGRGEWEIEEVWMESPLHNEPKIKLDPTNLIWGMVVDSISNDCGDQLWDKTVEFIAEHDDSDRPHMERA
jgi:hypothetical protein